MAFGFVFVFLAFLLFVWFLLFCFFFLFSFFGRMDLVNTLVTRAQNPFQSETKNSLGSIGLMLTTSKAAESISSLWVHVGGPNMTKVIRIRNQRPVRSQQHRGLDRYRYDWRLCSKTQAHGQGRNESGREWRQSQRERKRGQSLGQSKRQRDCWMSGGWDIESEQVIVYD